MKKVTFILAVLFSISLQAQWVANTDANMVVADTAISVINTIGTADGSTYIVYWKQLPPPTNFELRLQVLNADGVKQLGNSGVLVSDNIDMGTFTLVGTAVKDADENIYIGVTASNGYAGHVFKMDINGNHLWSPAGVSFSEGYAVTLLPLSNGEIVVSWINQPNALMQKYDATGNAVWASPQPVVSGTSKTAPAQMFELSNGNFMMIFHTYNFGINSTLYAQKYNASGAAQWATATQLSNKTTAYNVRYSGAQNGDNVYFGYVGKSSDRFDSFLQRVNPDGTLPWGINGADFDTNQTNFEMDTKIAVSANGQNVWAICTYTDVNQNEHGEYVQKFDSESGARQFTDNAKMLYAISTDFKEHRGNLYLANDKPFFLLKLGNDNGVTPTTLRAVLLDQNGDFAWTEMDKPVATFEANKSNVNLAEPTNGQAVAVWIEDKSNGAKIYAQNFTDDAITALTAIETANEAKVYPNPANNALNIALNSPKNALMQVEIYNPKGQLIATSKQLVQMGNNVININTHQLAPAAYCFQVKDMDGNINSTGKFIIQK
jgi:hypothetical protein